ncbi:MAG TPA: trigger factor [Kiritimatiellia bacterium]|nr:trigger factor [Kiritimatiellia bacterium]
MNIRVETVGPCRREIHVEVPVEQVQAVFEEVTASYAKVARVPGFRPGRAPRDLIRRRYQKDIAGDVKERLIPEGYQAAVKQEKLSTVAVLDVKEQALDEAQPFAFSVVLDVAPDFEMPAYKGIALTRKKEAVKEEDIDEVLKNIRDQNGRYEDIAGRPVQLGDLVQIDYTGAVDGQPVEQLAPNAKGMGEGKDFWLMADEQNQFLPGFAQGLAGASVGDQRNVTVDFPANFPEAALAGQKAVYTVLVKALREKKLPELDAEFLKGVGVASLDELRTRVREDLANLRERNETRRLQGEIVKQLLEKTQLDVPESTLQEETRQEVYELVRQNQQRGITAEDIEGHKEQLFDSATKSATDKVKLRYLLKKIAAEEQISVEENEVETRIRGLAASWGVPFDRLKADMQKRNALGQVRDDVLMSKVLARVMELASITEEGAAA